MKIEIDKNVFLIMIGMIKTINDKYACDLADFYLSKDDLTFTKYENGGKL